MTAARRGVLVLHWGRLGAGPLISARLADALARRGDGAVTLCLEVGADARPVEPAVETRLVSTYRGRVQLVLRLPHLLRLALAVRRLMLRRGTRVYLSPMLSVWQSLAVRLMVPRRVLAVTVIHDAAQHPGDAHPVLEICRRLELARADVVVAFSEHSAALLRAQVRRGVPVLALPHGTDRPRGVAPRALPERVRVGFFGRIAAYKGIEQFADAVALIAARHPGATGVVAGDGAVDPALVERTRGLIDWRIGWVGAGEVEAVVDGLDLVLLPYQEASQSGVLALAASRGVPVVATPVGGLAEQAAVLGNAVVAGGTDAAAVAEAAVALLGDPARYARLSAAGLAAAAGRTSWDAVADALLAGIECVSPARR